MIRHRLRDLLFPHPAQTVDDAVVVVGGAGSAAEGGAEDAGVGVDGVVGYGVAEVLEVNAELVRAACEGEAVDYGIAFSSGCCAVG